MPEPREAGRADRRRSATGALRGGNRQLNAYNGDNNRHEACRYPLPHSQRNAPKKQAEDSENPLRIALDLYGGFFAG